jgi:hypothetical protein
MFEDHDVFNINAFTLGVNYDLLEIKKTRLAAGAQWSIFSAPQALHPIYGQYPMSLQIYLRIYPALMKMNGRM